LKKIFISHSTKDADLATSFLDLLQNQFSLKRENFFLTSDEEFSAGQNWIEAIKDWMKDADIILPIITPNYLDSKFCLCELGAAWINEQSLLPVIIPNLDHRALEDTPYRSVIQSITLNSTKDFLRLAESMREKEIGKFNSVSFTTRANKLLEHVVLPYSKSLDDDRERITVEMMDGLKETLREYQEAYQEVNDELDRLRRENTSLRTLKDAEEVTAFDLENMDEWDKFLSAVEKVNLGLRQLSIELVTVLYYQFKNGTEGFYSNEYHNQNKFQDLESQGLIKWDDGWVPDYDHPKINRVTESLNEVSKLIDDNSLNDQFEMKFESEFQDIRLGLAYSPFWEEVFGTNILNLSS